MHRAYCLVRQRLKKYAIKSQTHHYNANKVSDIHYQPGDPVYLKNHHKLDKFGPNWLPHYRVLVKTSDYSYIIQHQVNGKTRKAHANHLRLANESESWDNPNNTDGRRQVRNATHDLEVSDLSSDSEDDLNDSEIGSEVDPDEETVPPEPVRATQPTQSHTPHSATNSKESDTGESNSQSKRPPRAAKTKAMSKLKGLQEVASSELTSDIPDTTQPQTTTDSNTQPQVQQQAIPNANIEAVVEQQLQSKLSLFMQSFNSAFSNVLQQNNTS